MYIQGLAKYTDITRIPGRGGRCVAAVAALLAVGIAATAADAHSVRAGTPGQLGVPGMSEDQLRRFETEVLGPQHAAEHARERRDLGSGRLRAASSGAQTAGVPAQPNAAVSTDPAVSGRWGTAFPIPVMGIHAAMLPTGKVMWWAYPKNPTRPYGDPRFPNTSTAWLWDPATGNSKEVRPPLWRDPADGKRKPANLWCAGQSFLADGRLLVTGGNLAYSGTGDPERLNYAGLNKVYTFNPFNETWTEQPNMKGGRWYPSQVLLPDGRTVIMAGLDESGEAYSTNTQIELFTPSKGLDARGKIKLLGTRGGQGAPPDGGLYPHLFTMPSGRVMVAGPDLNDSWFLDDPGSADGFTWSEFAPFSRRRLWGSAVLRPEGPGGSTKVTLIGGSQPDYTTSPASDAAGVATTETIDENEADAGWQMDAPMNIGRSHLNTVLLPDSSMVTVGGGIGTREPEGQWAADPEQRQVELFDPATGGWRLGAAQAESRAYHSTALLLPDARVISAGDDLNGGIDRDTAEVYEPPYLFKGARPSITSAPASVRINEAFNVNASGPAVTKAVLVAPGAVTHANDMSQRVVPLTLSQRAGGVRLTAPPNGRVAPPGYYMLFLLSDHGVPSVAKFVKVLPGSPAPADPTGLVAQYSFNEGTGTTAGDSSGRGNAGTLSGPAWAAGKTGGGLSFDGTNDSVTVPDASSLDLTTGMTLEAWVKPRVASSGWRSAILKERPGGLTYALYPRNGAGAPNAAAGSTDVNGPSALRIGAWSHLAATFDGTSLRLYVNGAQVAKEVRPTSLPVSSGPLKLGGNSIWGEWFDGTLDDVRVYNRALTASEVQSDRDLPIGGASPPPPDDTAPQVAITSPADGATVSGVVTVTAGASDNLGVAGVRFKLDGASLGTEDTTSPYSVSWDARGLSSRSHKLEAVALDAAGNSAVSPRVTVTVQSSGGRVSGESLLERLTESTPAPTRVGPPRKPARRARGLRRRCSIRGIRHRSHGRRAALRRCASAAPRRKRHG